ncbi:hypothetical protein RN001_015436 [Aquatica leii]|uniref:SAM domain-containing protein n=1 Tax=Aquatica leii TaxID=1421715 RepID=A0AAN7SC20_9COLE|nr:hypothetical protein RN001_015436 [Aquatica leii]
MDLLETVLRSANAETYIELFRKNKIEADTLPLLSVNDLQILGVHEKPLQVEILSKASHLQIPHEKSVGTVLGKEDVELILHQISYQLNLHHALLSCAIIRDDLILCDVKLNKATKCLLNCMNFLEKQVNEFEAKVFDKKDKQYKCKIVVLLSATTISMFILGKFCNYF